MNKDRRRFSQAIFAILTAQTIAMSAWQAPVFADSTQVIGLNNDGVKALNAGNYQLAIQKFQAALNIDPNYGLARDNLAIAHNNFGLQQRNNPKAALKEFHQALYLNPSNSTTQANVEGIIRMMGKNPRNFQDRVGLGEDSRRSGDFIGAIIEFSEALKLKDDPAIHVKLGEVYRVLDQNDKAIDEFKAAAQGGDNANIEVKLGQAYQAKGDLPQAIGCYGRAITFKSDDPDVQEALKTGWEKAVNENPLAPENHIGLGQAFQYRGDFGQARGEYKQAISIAGGKNSQVAATAQRLLEALPAAEKSFNFNKHQQNGIDLQTSKQYDAAIAEYLKALEIDPSNATILANIGSAFQQKGDLQNALAYYSKALKTDPNNAVAREGAKATQEALQDKQMTDTSNAAAALFKQGKFDDAIQKYQQLIQINPKEPGTHFDLGATYQAKKDFDSAISEYKTAIALDPANANYKKALDKAIDGKVEPILADAFTLFKNKDYGGAIDKYTEAQKWKPDNPAIAFNIASAEYARQNFAPAKAAYARALQLDRPNQINDLYFIGTIDENDGKGQQALSDYQKYIAEAPKGTYTDAAKARITALSKNPNDTQKIKSETELAQIKTASDDYQKAVQLQQQAKFADAEPLYLAAIKLQPKEASYAYALGTLYQQMQNYDNAIQYYSLASQLDPTNKDYPRVLAEANELKAAPIVDAAVKKQTSGDLTGAIELYKQAAQVAPNNARLWTNMGTAYQQSDKFDIARDAYQKAYNLDSKNEVGDLYLMAAIDENYGRGSQALQGYQKYLLAQPKGDYANLARTRVAALQSNISNTVKLTTTTDIKNAKAAQDNFDLGVKLQGESKFDDAIAAYQKAASVNPKESAYQYAIGTAYQAKGDMTSALASYQQALSLAAPNSEQAKTYQKAISDGKLLSAAPIMDEAVKKHGDKQYAAAIELYQKALAIDPNNARGFTNMAAAYQAADNYVKAQQSYEKALSLDPKGESEDWYYLGLLDENNSQGAKAVQDYQHYLLSQPKGSYADVARQRVNELRANPAKTQKILSSADQAKSADAQAAYDAAVKLQTDNKFDDALAQYAKAIAAQPSESSYYYGRGTAYQGLAATKPDTSDDYQKYFKLAIDDYKKACDLNPREATYKQTLKSAQSALAAPLVNSAIKKQTTKDDKGNYDLQGAINDYEAALKLDEDPGTLSNLGTAYQALGNKDKALSDYKRALQMNPNLPDAWYFLGTLYEDLKQPGEALRSYRKYLQLAATGPYANDVKERLKVLAPAKR